MLKDFELDVGLISGGKRLAGLLKGARGGIRGK